MDKAYEGDETRQLAMTLGYTPVVPPKENRITPWEYDRAGLARIAEHLNDIPSSILAEALAQADLRVDRVLVLGLGVGADPTIDRCSPPVLGRIDVSAEPRL